MPPFDPSIPVPEPADPAQPIEPAGEPSAATEAAVPSGARRRRSSGPSRFSLILVALVAGSALFLGGYSLGAHVATSPGTPAGEEARFAPFWDVYTAIGNEYAGSPRPSQDELVKAAIKGMMDSLNDQWSYYQGPADFENSLLNVGGQALGIGVQVALQPIDPASSLNCQTIGNGCELAVVKPIAGSPAAAAGIRPGDVIVAVDGVGLAGLSIDAASAKIKGAKGTTVTLRLDRAGSKVELSIVRQSYTLPQVNTRTLAGGKVAYIEVTGVNGGASSQFDAALKDALAAGERSVIIDLRGNPGGYVNDAVKIASEFIGSGAIVYQQDASSAQTEITAEPNGRATSPAIGVVVLVDKGTASAAEILAGALQARGRAKLAASKVRPRAP